MTRPCRRCGAPAENPLEGSGIVPDGKGGSIEIEDLVVCGFCLDLLNADDEKLNREYWDVGWKIQPEGT